MGAAIVAECSSCGWRVRAVARLEVPFEVRRDDAARRFYEV
jgi:hypothetical protein